MIKNLIKLDEQDGLILWQLDINGDTVYNVTRVREVEEPDSGYFKVDYLEKFYGVKFNIKDKE